MGSLQPHEFFRTASIARVILNSNHAYIYHLPFTTRVSFTP